MAIALYGTEDGLNEACAEFGAEHIADVRTNENGTPLVSDALEHAAKAFGSRLLLFANSDIIFCDDLLISLDRVELRTFLVVGNRINVVVKELVDFSQPGSAARLRNRAHSDGVLQPPVGSDYFAFPRETRWQMPDLAVGRLGWDNWMIFRARQMGIPVIDATPTVTAIHQNHDYGHVKSRPRGLGVQPGVEDSANLFAAGGVEAMFTLWDVDFQLVDGRLVRPTGFKYVRRRAQSALVLSGVMRPGYRLVRSVWANLRSALRRRGWLGRGTEILNR